MSYIQQMDAGIPHDRLQDPKNLAELAEQVGRQREAEKLERLKAEAKQRLEDAALLKQLTKD